MRFSRMERRRRFGFESLECRRPLAGNVTASVSPFDGTLSLTGDGYANAVDVRGTGVVGEVLITPLVDVATGQQTNVTFNGNTSSSPVLLQGVAGLASSLQSGNDELYVKDFAFSGNGRIWGGQGADTVRLGALVSYGQTGTGDVSFGGSLRIDEQGDVSVYDNDYVFLGRVRVNEFLEINGYYGDDTTKFYNVTVLGQNIGLLDALKFNGGDGNDLYDVAYTTAWGGTGIWTDGVVLGGHDLVSVITSAFHGRTYIDVWHGTNTVAMNANHFYGTIDLYSETGNDTVILTNSLCDYRVNLTSFFWASNGNDTFRVEGNYIFERIYLNAGSGSDSVTIRANQIATASILCGTGYDVAFVRYNYFTGAGPADFSGGTALYPETDVLYHYGNSYGYGFYEFESIQYVP